MRLRDLFERLETLERVPFKHAPVTLQGSQSGFVKLTALRQLQQAIAELLEAHFYEEQSRALLANEYLKVGQDDLNIEAGQAQGFINTVDNYRRVAQVTAAVLRPIIGDEPTTRFAVRLPPLDSLAALADVTTKLDEALRQTFGLLRLGDYKLVGFDSGSFWYDLLVHDLTPVNIVLSILAAAKTLLAKKREDDKAVASMADALKHAQTTDLEKHKVTVDGMLKMHAEALRAQREAYARVLAQEHLPKDTDPETVSKIAIVVMPIYVDLVERDLDIVPALPVRQANPAEYANIAHQLTTGDKAPPNAPQLEAPKSDPDEPHKSEDEGNK